MTASKHDPYRLYLTEDQIPKAWYNLRADMPEKPEPMRLPNGAVATKPDIAPVFADALSTKSSTTTPRTSTSPNPS